MKIGVIARARDEEKMIGSFIEAYVDWVDGIFIVDGGSQDHTPEILDRLSNFYPNLHWDFMTERVYGTRGVWTNHTGKQLKTLLEMASEMDWIVFDDVDCRPNYLLKQDGRDILLTTSKDAVFVTRLYVWGDTGKHFPKLAQPAKRGQWEPSLWAWRTGKVVPDYGVRYDQQFTVMPSMEHRHYLYPPYCLLHHPWPDEARLFAKSYRYKNTYYNDGRQRNFVHPLQSGGPLEDLPEWARE